MRTDSRTTNISDHSRETQECSRNKCYFIPKKSSAQGTNSNVSQHFSRGAGSEVTFHTLQRGKESIQPTYLQQSHQALIGEFSRNQKDEDSSEDEKEDEK